MNRIFILLINCKNITLGIALIKKSVTSIVSWLALVYGVLTRNVIMEVKK